MTLALSPMLRFGPGGDFTVEVFGDRVVPESSVARGEPGGFDPHSGGGGSSRFAQGKSGGRREEDERALWDEMSDCRADGLSDTVEFRCGTDLGGQGPSVRVLSDGRDGCDLSSLARHAGGLMVAHRLVTAHSSVLRGVHSNLVSMMGALRRVVEPVRTVRHGAERGAGSEPGPAGPTSDSRGLVGGPASGLCGTRATVHASDRAGSVVSGSSSSPGSPALQTLSASAWSRVLRAAGGKSPGGRLSSASPVAPALFQE